MTWQPVGLPVWIDYEDFSGDSDVELGKDSGGHYEKCAGAGEGP